MRTEDIDENSDLEHLNKAAEALKNKEAGAAHTVTPIAETMVLNAGAEAPYKNEEDVSKAAPRTAEEAEIIRKRYEEIKEQHQAKDSVTTVNSPEAKTRYAKPENLGDEWLRLDFPSKNVAYDNVSDIFARKLTTEDLIPIYESIENKNRSGYIDALDNCLSIDIRDLTIPDFVYFQYWLRLTSYPRSPLTTEWISRYGNRQELNIRSTDINIVFLKMTREEYANWKDRGIAFPTVRDSEIIVDEQEIRAAEGKVSAKMWLMQNAQYLYVSKEEMLQPDLDDKIPDLMRIKIRKLRKASPETLVDIRTFQELSDHGVEETVTVSDAAFEPRAAIQYLRQSAQQLKLLAENTMEEVSGDLERTSGLMQFVELANENNNEADIIEYSLRTPKEGEPIPAVYKPREEVVELRRISPPDMFPNSDPSMVAQFR